MANSPLTGKRNLSAPKQGDSIIIDAKPHAGREYGGHDPRRGNIRRHLIVLSNTDYNQLTGMVVGMAITTTNFADMSGYLPFVDLESKTKGNIILWQLPTFDQVARHASIIGHVSPSMLNTLKKAAIDIFE